jgi:Ca2+-binding RTX toxin-like protein
VFTGHSFGQLKVAKSGGEADLSLTFTNNADQVIINGGALNQYERGIEVFEFKGGVAKTLGDLRALYIAQQQTAGADQITGFYGWSDTFTAGRGNDTLNGLGGNDTYIYNNGDGVDTIDDAGYFAGDADKLVFTGHTFGQLKVAKSGGEADLSLTFTNNADQVIINGGALNQYEKGIEVFEFKGGVVKTLGDLRALYIAQRQTAGADQITGFYGWSDTFTAGRGNDTLNGLGGNDTYIYNNGDGVDTIDDAGYFAGDADKLVFTGHTFGQLKVAKSGGEADLSLTFTNNADQVIINRGAQNQYERGVEVFEFKGGVVKTLGDLRALYIAQRQTAGADQITGFYGWADTFISGAGDDVLTGLSGNDSFVFAGRFGKDTISDFWAGTYSEDVIQLSLGTNFDSYAEVMDATSQVGNNTVINISANDTITLTGVAKANLVEGDFSFF